MPKRTDRAVRIGAVMLLLLGVFGCNSGEAEQRRAEAFVARWRALYDSHEADGLSALYAETGNARLPGMLYFTPTRAQLRASLMDVWRRSPGLKVVDDPVVVADNERIAVLLYVESNVGGRKVRQPTATFMTVRNGVVVEQVTVAQNVN